MIVVIDIWGGERHMDHLARLLRPFDEAMAAMVRRELGAGFLVNLRQDIAWGTEEEFDLRAGHA